MPIDQVRSAVEEGRWAQALELLDALGDAARTPDALELRARAAYGSGQFEAAVSAWEALYALLIAEGDRVGAARAAAMIAMYLMMDTGLMAPVRGWMHRADRLLEGEGETAAHAILAMVRTYERFMSGDIAEAGRQAAMATDLGQRFEVNPAVVIGRTAAARVNILLGDVEEGLNQLNDVALVLMSGRADPLTTGMMYCELICAVQGLAMYDLAAEWTDVMEHWRHGAAFGGINGRCRVHRAEVLRMTGPSCDAEEEALGACDELRPWMRREFGWPLVELGNIRLRRGDLEGAEEAYLAAHAHAWQPQPGLALLRLAQGDADAAAALIADAIAHPLDVPSKERPPFGDLRLAPLLEAQVEIASARRDTEVAVTASEALVAIAARYPSRPLAAGAALAQARAALLRGDTAEAITRCSEALPVWVDIGAPYEAASVRVVLGEAHRRDGNMDAARLEWRAALGGFEGYGAIARAGEVAALLDDVGGRVAQRTPEQEELAQFSRRGDLRTVVFGGSTAVLRDLVGFRYIERLVADPGREFHVLDLVGVEHGTLPTGRHADRGDLHTTDGALPVLDEQARAAYRRRLDEVDADIDEARACNDLARLERAELDRDYLVAELSRAVGLGGRLRRSGSTSERARSRVARSIRYALDQLARQQPEAAAHLRHAIRTGTYCAYEPDPRARVAWTT